MPATKRGLQTAPAVSEKSEMIEIGTTDATTEDTDPGPKRGGEIEVDLETGQKSLVGSGATQGKEEGEGIRMESEMGREIGRIGNAAGVEISTGRGEVGALRSMLKGTKADNRLQMSPHHDAPAHALREETTLPPAPERAHHLDRPNRPDLEVPLQSLLATAPHPPAPAPRPEIHRPNLLLLPLQIHPPNQAPKPTAPHPPHLSLS